jgi:hypothetical protein
LTVTWAQILSDNSVAADNPPKDSGVYPFGINGFSWELGGDEYLGDPTRVPSLAYSAMTGWFIIYQEATALHGPAKPTVPCTVSMRNAAGYVHFKTGGWALVQDPAQQNMIVSQLDPHQTGNTGTPTVTHNSDGSWSWASAPAGSINHGWPNDRGSFTAGTVDGVYWSFEMKVDKAGANLIAANGADWWTAASGASTNTGYSQSIWKRLNTSYQLFTGTSLPLATLQQDPPPPLASLVTVPPPVVPPPVPPVVPVSTLTFSLNGQPLKSGDILTITI